MPVVTIRGQLGSGATEIGRAKEEFGRGLRTDRTTKNPISTTKIATTENAMTSFFTPFRGGFFLEFRSLTLPEYSRVSSPQYLQKRLSAEIDFPQLPQVTLSRSTFPQARQNLRFA